METTFSAPASQSGWPSSIARDLAERLALVEDERGDVDEADRVRGGRARDRDHGAAVGVADEQDGPVDLADEARDVLGVGGEPAQGVRRREHRDAAGLELLDDRRPERRVGEATVNEDDGGDVVAGGAHVCLLRGLTGCSRTPSKIWRHRLHLVRRATGRRAAMTYAAGKPGVRHARPGFALAAVERFEK
jgi:hypothetical protein